MRDYIEDFKKVAIYSVIVMIAFLIALAIIGLVISLFNELFISQSLIENKQDFLTLLGNILVVVIAVELLDTLVLYMKRHRLSPELILLVVLTAVARDVLVTDLVHADPLLLLGIGAVIIAIAGAYYLIRRAAWEASIRGEDVVAEH